MRVVIFTDTFVPNRDGVITSILNCVSRLAPRHTFLIIAPDYGHHREIRLHPNVTIMRVKSFPLPTYKDFRFVLPYYAQCIDAVRAFNPDVIHIETYATLGLLGTRVAKKLNVPLIGTYHTIAAEFLRYAFPLHVDWRQNRFTRRLMTTKRVSLRLPKDSAMKRLVWGATIRLYRSCDLVTVPSSAIRHELTQRNIGKETIVVSNGIDTTLFKPKKTYARKATTFIHVGRISYEKNVDKTIEAFALIAQHHPDIQYRIIGDGPALDDLKKLVKDLKLTRRVSFSGYIVNKDLPREYRTADVFVTASAMETQGLVILEAMAAGLPVIGVRAFAIPDIVKEGRNGYVVPPGDVHAMAAKMELLLNNPHTIEVLGKRSAAMAQPHDIAVIVKKWDRIYARVARQNPR